MNKLKHFIKFLLEEISWFFACLMLKKTNENRINSILLIPAADLNGGFGDDIMVTSFIENFGKGYSVSIFTAKKIVRNDYLSKFKNINFIGGYKERNYLKTLRVMKDFDKVFVLGADIMDGAYGYYGALNRLRTLQLAQKMGIGSYISGFSISNNIIPRIQKELKRTSEKTIIKARDIESFNRLKTFLNEDRILLTNDIAFICPDILTVYENKKHLEYTKWCGIRKSEGSSIIAFCPNAHQADKIGLDNYVNDLKILINKFLSKSNFSIVFLYHDLRPLCDNQSDNSLSGTLYEFCIANGINAYYNPEIKNGIELKGYLKYVDFTVTGRMHLGISGYTFNKAMFGLGYQNKFEGMVKLFDLESNNCLVDFNDIPNSLSIVDEYLDNYQKIKEKIILNFPAIKQNTLKNFINE